MGKLNEAIELLEKAAALVREDETAEALAENYIYRDRLCHIKSEIDGAITHARKHVAQKHLEAEQARKSPFMRPLNHYAG